MRPRHCLARIAAFVTAAAAIGMFLGPARADASDHDDPDGTVNEDLTSAMADDRGGTLLEGWANRDLDIGDFSRSMAEELGSRLDGYDTPEMVSTPLTCGRPWPSGSAPAWTAGPTATSISERSNYDPRIGRRMRARAASVCTRERHERRDQVARS